MSYYLYVADRLYDDGNGNEVSLEEHLNYISCYGGTPDMWSFVDSDNVLDATQEAQDSGLPIYIVDSDNYKVIGKVNMPEYLEAEKLEALFSILDGYSDASSGFLVNHANGIQLGMKSNVCRGYKANIFTLDDLKTSDTLLLCCYESGKTLAELNLSKLDLTGLSTFLEKSDKKSLLSREVISYEETEWRITDSNNQEKTFYGRNCNAFYHGKMNNSDDQPTYLGPFKTHDDAIQHREKLNDLVSSLSIGSISRAEFHCKHETLMENTYITMALSEI